MMLGKLKKVLFRYKFIGKCLYRYVCFFFIWMEMLIDIFDFCRCLFSWRKVLNRYVLYIC